MKTSGCTDQKSGLPCTDFPIPGLTSGRGSKILALAKRGTHAGFKVFRAQAEQHGFLEVVIVVVLFISLITAAVGGILSYVEGVIAWARS